MLLYTLKNKEDLISIGNMLKRFEHSKKPKEYWFAGCMPYVLRSCFVYCPELEGKLIGIGYIFKGRGIVPSLGMAVLPEYQGRGVGKDIMREVLDYTKTKTGWLLSSIWNDNQPIINLHLKNGFELIRKDKLDSWYVISYGVIPVLLKNILKLCGRYKCN